MEALTKTVEPVNKIFVKNIYPIVSEPHFSVLVSFLLLFNIIYSAGSIPPNIKALIVHPITRIILVFSLTYRMYGNFLHAAIATAVVIGFVTFLEKYRREIYYMAEEFKIISPVPDVYPGCVDITVKDLLLLFDGDEPKLKAAMEKFGVPYDLDLNDTNAPIIATYFINFGHKITETCNQPA